MRRVLTQAATYVNLEDTMLREDARQERSQVVRCCFSDISGAGKSVETERRLVIPRGWDKRELEVPAEWVWGFFSGALNMPWN